MSLGVCVFPDPGPSLCSGAGAGQKETRWPARGLQGPLCLVSLGTAFCLHQRQLVRLFFPRMFWGRTEFWGRPRSGCAGVSQGKWDPLQGLGFRGLGALTASGPTLACAGASGLSSWAPSPVIPVGSLEPLCLHSLPRILSVSSVHYYQVRPEASGLLPLQRRLFFYFNVVLELRSLRNVRIAKGILKCVPPCTYPHNRQVRDQALELSSTSGLPWGPRVH